MACCIDILDTVLENISLSLADMWNMWQSDKELHAHILGSGIPPFFALGWFITWFSHNVPDLGDISRIFDALMASHPLMPIYLSAAVMQVKHAESAPCTMSLPKCAALCMHVSTMPADIT